MISKMITINFISSDEEKKVNEENKTDETIKEIKKIDEIFVIRVSERIDSYRS